MHLGTLWEAVVPAAFAAGLSPTVHATGDWARVSTPARNYISTYITTTDWHQDHIKHGVLGLSE